MIEALDVLSLVALAAFYVWIARDLAMWERLVLALAKTSPAALLIFSFGPQGGALLLLFIAAFAHALNDIQLSAAGRAHLVAGLSAGALFASGPFGAVFTGGALLILIFGAQATPLKSRIAHAALIVFVPLVVIGGFSIAAQAQTGDLFALTCKAAGSLSRLSRWLPQWPAPMIAATLMPCLAPNALARMRDPDGLSACAILGGGAAALVTFGSTIDGVVESALAASLIANAAPVARVRSIAFVFLLLGGAGALLLCHLTAPSSAGLTRPSVTLWQIGKRVADAPPPWGIDHAP